jgi:hypothetical protein
MVVGKRKGKRRRRLNVFERLLERRRRHLFHD